MSSLAYAEQRWLEPPQEKQQQQVEVCIDFYVDEQGKEIYYVS
jgi:hypothetical protein